MIGCVLCSAKDRNELGMVSMHFPYLHRSEGPSSRQLLNPNDSRKASERKIKFEQKTSERLLLPIVLKNLFHVIDID